MITQTQLDQVSEFARQQDIISDNTVMELRGNFPDIHFTYCMDDDVMVARPVYEDKAFNLYLIDSRNHCLNFTQEMDIATGIVLAEIEDEE